MEGYETAAERLLKSGQKRAPDADTRGPIRKAMEENETFLALIDSGFEHTVIQQAFAEDYPELCAQHPASTVLNAIGTIKRMRKRPGLIPSAASERSSIARKRTDKPTGTKTKPVEIASVAPEPGVTVEAPLAVVEEPIAVVEEPAVEMAQESEAVEVEDTPIPGFEVPVRGFETSASKPISPAPYVLPKTKKTTL